MLATADRRTTVDESPRPSGAGDFNGDGKSDILWRDTTGGTVAIWLMSGAQVTAAVGVGSGPFSLWSIVETGDFDGDGKSDIGKTPTAMWQCGL